MGCSVEESREKEVTVRTNQLYQWFISKSRNRSKWFWISCFGPVSSFVLRISDFTLAAVAARQFLEVIQRFIHRANDRAGDAAGLVKFAEEQQVVVVR